MNRIIMRVNIYLSRHKKLAYVLKCLKHVNDRNFINSVLGSNPEAVTFSHLGNENQNKIIYLIEIGFAGDGFFAEYRRMLNYLYYADIHSFTPYVVFNKQYSFTPMDYESNNSFLCYFDEYFAQDYELIMHSRNLVSNSISHLWPAENLKEKDGYALSEKYISEMAKISKKYIHLCKSVNDYVMSGISEIGLNEPDKMSVLGVHVRGSDFKNNFKGHPVYISAEEFLERTKNEFSSGRYEKIFLATDDRSALTLFKNTFGDDLIFYRDVARTDGNTSVAFDRESGADPFTLGRQVLRDMITLSKCTSLIAGKSQVSICAIISNRAWEKGYKNMIIIDKGINRKGHLYMY